MVSEPVLLYEKGDDGVAWVTLNRPRVLNAMNMAVRDEMWSVMGAVGDDPDVRAVVIRGAGERAFSAGADISEFGTAPSFVEARRARQERDVWAAMLACIKPLVAAIHGIAYGAGCEMALFCDIRIASDDATFALPEVTLGYIPSAGGTQMLPRAVPPGVAREMISAGNRSMRRRRCVRGWCRGSCRARSSRRGGGGGGEACGSAGGGGARCEGSDDARRGFAAGRGAAVGDGDCDAPCCGSAA